MKEELITFRNHRKRFSLNVILHYTFLQLLETPVVQSVYSFSDFAFLGQTQWTSYMAWVYLPCFLQSMTSLILRCTILC